MTSYKQSCGCVANDEGTIISFCSAHLTKYLAAQETYRELLDEMKGDSAANENEKNDS